MEIRGTGTPYTVRLSSLIQDLLGKGWHPSQIRRELAARGIRWKYGFNGRAESGRRIVHGERERARRLRQRGLRLCTLCEVPFPVPADPDLDTCPECLARKWGSGTGFEQSANRAIDKHRGALERLADR